MQMQPKRILITGSCSGIGLMAANLLAEQGHFVVIHGRSQERVVDVLQTEPTLQTAIYGDLSSLEDIKKLALHSNEIGPFDAIIHNAVIYPDNIQMAIHKYL